jgi:hypothetical protein
LGPERERRDLFPDNAMRPADVFLKNWIQGRDAALDVTVTSPLQQEQVHREAANAGVAIEARKRTKMTPYFEKCREVGIKFVPLVVTTLGGWNKEASLQLQRIARALGRRSDTDDGIAIRHLMQRLSVRLQRGNATLFMGRRPPPPAASISGPDPA